MSAKFAFATTFAAILLLNGLSAGAMTQSIAKDAKKNDKKPAIAVSYATSQQLTKEKKKDDGKKQEITLASGVSQSSLMKPAGLREYQIQHRHHRHSINA
jgi:hypothetical protein